MLFVFDFCGGGGAVGIVVHRMTTHCQFIVHWGRAEFFFFFRLGFVYRSVHSLLGGKGVGILVHRQDFLSGSVRLFSGGVVVVVYFKIQTSCKRFGKVSMTQTSMHVGNCQLALSFTET